MASPRKTQSCQLLFSLGASQKKKLSLQYAIKLAANPSNPAHEVTFPPTYVDLYEQKPKAIKSFGIRISPLLESANIKPQNIEKHFTPNIPAWCMKPPEILFGLGVQWLSGRVLDSRPKGRGFEPHRCHCVVVLELDTFILF